jgi:hypothetical protein
VRCRNTAKACWRRKTAIPRCEPASTKRAVVPDFDYVEDLEISDGHHMKRMRDCDAGERVKPPRAALTMSRRHANIIHAAMTAKVASRPSPKSPRKSPFPAQEQAYRNQEGDSRES